MSNSVDPDQASQKVRPDQGTNCIQRLPTNNKLYHCQVVLTLKAPITTAADDKFCDVFSNFQKKIRYDLMKYHALLLLLFLKKRQHLKLSSAANYRWHFMG